MRALRNQKKQKAIARERAQVAEVSTASVPPHTVLGPNDDDTNVGNSLELHEDDDDDDYPTGDDDQEGDEYASHLNHDITRLTCLRSVTSDKGSNPEGSLEVRIHEVETQAKHWLPMAGRIDDLWCRVTELEKSTADWRQRDNQLPKKKLAILNERMQRLAYSLQRCAATAAGVCLPIVDVPVPQSIDAPASAPQPGGSSDFPGDNAVMAPRLASAAEIAGGDGSVPALAAGGGGSVPAPAAGGGDAEQHQAALRRLQDMVEAESRDLKHAVDDLSDKQKALADALSHEVKDRTALVSMIEDLRNGLDAEAAERIAADQRPEVGDIQEAFKNHDLRMNNVLNALQQVQKKKEDLTEDIINLKNEMNTKLDTKVDNVLLCTVRGMCSSLRVDAEAQRCKVDEVLVTIQRDTADIRSNVLEKIDAMEQPAELRIAEASRRLNALDL